ncbi:putative receptor-like protein kinase At3g47110 [Camellia sinensis]|uniref:putative receptor-like protein kinase At3g47110 n=1 Tax=Camellia sinensis TaxID=4442 RepID=UPI001036C4E7|nr:putative receptor-like protein kinase At3g47110 [Camellia sinensis]
MRFAGRSGRKCPFLGGSIPNEIQNLINLNVLGMEYNLLIGIMGKLSNLKSLYLRGNHLMGEIPSNIGNMTQLFYLLLNNNSLQGNIPENKLNDTIPELLMNLLSLSVGLDILYNSLTGTLLVEVGNLKELLILDVSYNKLSGEIPSALGRCLALVQLYMQQNLFHGIIPSISQLTGLQYLDLSSNKFSGQIPQYMVNLSFLLNLNLSNNNLEGEVPTQGVFSNASAVEIYNNIKLCGGIPKLHLHRCPTQELQKPGKHTTLKLVLVIVIPIFLIGLTLFLLSFYPIRKLKQKSLETYSFGRFFPKISYTDLLKATDGFSTENLIGSGHHGRVYKGMLSPDESTVAVKVLNLHQRGAAKSFVAECQVLRNIRHRNLVKVLTACSSTDYEGNEFKALVYEFMPNGTLESWLHPRDGQSQTRKLNFLQRINIAIDVAFALHYLHNECQMPIVHCDIKPSNILLDNDLTAHVSDFGLARLLNVYVPIEVSTRGDTYSFGILLLEMFTGRRPTDELFKDDLNLHNFAKMALCGRVTEIVDQFLSSEVMQGVQDCIGSSSEHTRIEFLVSVFQIGVACSYDFPIDRMNMSDVVLEFLLVKDKFLGNGVRDNTTQFTSEISEAIV